MADYVPFYFAPRSPMVFKLAKGGVPTYTDGQDPLIYLMSTVEAVVQAGLRYLFSDEPRRRGHPGIRRPWAARVHGGLGGNASTDVEAIPPKTLTG